MSERVLKIFGTGVENEKQTHKHIIKQTINKPTTIINNTKQLKAGRIELSNLPMLLNLRTLTFYSDNQA